MSDVLQTLVTALAALGAVLGAIVLAGRVARQVRSPVGRRLLLRETIALDRARRLTVVACDGRELLLLTGGGADVVVGWLPAAPADGGVQ